MSTENVAAVDIPVAPGDTNSQLADIRRNSTTGIYGVQISKPKPIPNYLRPSTGSCHDHCKYGARRDNSQIQNQITRRHAKTAQSENVRRQPKTAKSRAQSQLKTKNTEKKVPTCTKSEASSTKPTSSLSKTQTLGSTNKKNNIELKTINPETMLADVPSDRKTIEYENVPEKTLYVVEVEDGTQSDDKKTNSMRARKRDPQESNGCMVLKFRQAKTVGQTKNEKVEYEKKSLKKVVSDRSSISTDANTSSSSHRVIPRPQAIEKQDTYPTLYNRVIKETASKLVQTRKSRVKALVGAFETVINLQENKSSRTVTTL